MPIKVETKQPGLTTSRSATRLTVVSMDSHVAPPVGDYRKYVEQKYLEQFDDFVAAFAELLQSNPGAGTPFNKYSFEPSEQSRAYWREIELRFNDPANYADAATRLGTMDADGISAEVVFHGGHNRQPQPFFSPEINGPLGQHIPKSAETAELRAAGMRAYNRWLADWIAADPDRLIGIAYLPVWDLDAAVKEVNRIGAMGLRAFNLPAPRAGLRTYNVEDYDPFWAACAEQGMTLHSHVATGETNPPDQGQGYFSMCLSELEYASRRHLWHMIFGGVFERHPGLKLSLTEQAGIWVTPTLQNLDSVYLAEQQARETPHIKELLPRLPSEYFMSNIYIGASFTSRFEVQASIDGGYSHKMMWGRDFPHPEGTWPCTRESLRYNFAGFPDHLVRSILGGTAVGFLDLNAGTLEQVAERVGPTFEEVQTPLEGVPPEGHLSHGFRLIGPYA